jgi:hypothetical protein
MTTPERLYNEYHRETFFVKNKFYPTPMVNFENARKRDDWPCFVKASEMINGNPHLDARNLVISLADAYGGRFDPGLLTHQKGFKIYRAYIKELHDRRNVNAEHMDATIREGIGNVLEACRVNGISSFDEYLGFNSSFIPLVAMQHSSGQITSLFLALVPEIENVISGFPPDIRAEYFAEFLEKYEGMRTDILKYPRIRKYSDNIHKIIDRLIEKQNKQAILN